MDDAFFCPVFPDSTPSPSCPSDVAQVEIGLLYPPVGGDLLGLVALHVFLHGGEAGAVLQADSALVGGSAVVGPEMFDHGRVISGPLVTQLALERFLTCRGEMERSGGAGCPGHHLALSGCPPKVTGQSDLAKVAQGVGCRADHTYLLPRVL